MNRALAGPLAAALGVLFFSVNDVTIKYLSDTYALHMLVMVRSFIGMLTVLLVFVPLAGGLGTLRTKRLKEHLIRAAFVVIANLSFFLGLTTLEIADAVAIFFVSPLIITVLSVVFLREKVGPRRWIAVLTGFVGVLIIMQPGGDGFQLAYLLPLLAACAYASLNIMTRRLGTTESAAAMAFYIQITFMSVCIIFGLIVGDGRFDVPDNPALSFLFRAWDWPAAHHYWAFLAIGLATGIGGYLISLAYKLAEAALVAPFEYIAMPISIFWGYMIFDTWPAPNAWVGIALILGSGIFIVVRENRAQVLRR